MAECAQLKVSYKCVHFNVLTFIFLSNVALEPLAIQGGTQSSIYETKGGVGDKTIGVKCIPEN